MAFVSLSEEEETLEFPFFHVKIQDKDRHLQHPKRALIENSIYGTLTVDFSAF